MILFQTIIERRDLRLNPEVLYLFGDNEARKGLGGQAASMRGEPNAVGIRTKVAPTMRTTDLWHDRDFLYYKGLIDDDFRRVFRHVADGLSVVVPADGIGTGRALLPQNAPNTFKYIKNTIVKLERLSWEVADPTF